MSQKFTEEPLSYTSTSISATSITTTTTTTSAEPALSSQGRRRMSAHDEADAARAMRRTNSWTPVYQRRQSWNKEDLKHAMCLADIDAVKTGPGFTERV